MNIYILRDGNEEGPFSEEATQEMLKQGSVLIGDLAWREGMPSWLPLHAVLYPGPQVSEDQLPPLPLESIGGGAPASPPPAPVSAEPATAKQKALLTYLGMKFGSDLTKDQAASLVNDAMEDPKHTARVAQWTEDRLRLHPDLFAAELQAKKEDRARHYFEICQLEGAEYFTKVTKAHCQVLVGFLDVNHPRWDANEAEAARNYFFPAIAEKFPQLVQKQWVGKLHYPSASKVAPEVARRGPAQPPRKESSLFAALVRGVFFGALILAILWFVWNALRPPNGSELMKSAVSTKPSSTGEAAAGGAATAPAPAIPADSSLAMTTPADPLAPTSPPEGMTPAPATEGATPAASPSMGGSLFDDKPAAPTAPSSSTSLVPEAPPVRTTVLLTKPFDAQLTYGNIKLPPGTALRLISHDGAIVKAMYLNKVLMIPASSTDIDSPPPAASAPGSPATASVPPAAP